MIESPDSKIVDFKMADALNDEWWVSGGHSDEETPTESEEITAMNRCEDETKQKVAKKRHSTTDTVTSNGKNGNSRKRPKKKRITEATLNSCGASSKDFCLSLTNFFDGKLSVVEKEALALSDEHFGPMNVDLSHTVSSFLKQALPKWQRIFSAHNHKMAPLVIILSSNANRALNLNREALSFKGEKCKTAKLFARHLKPEAQAKFLESNAVHFAIGTPARVAMLLAQGSLVLSHTRLVMIDWNWRDQKLKRMVDIVDIRNSLMGLLKDYIVPACKSGHLKIGLF